MPSLYIVLRVTVTPLRFESITLGEKVQTFSIVEKVVTTKIVGIPNCPEALYGSRSKCSLSGSDLAEQGCGAGRDTGCSAGCGAVCRPRHGAIRRYD